MGLFGKEVFILAQIIVVEDDVYMREELIDMLKKTGYDAVPLPAFENAVSQLAELSPDARHQSPLSFRL